MEPTDIVQDAVFETAAQRGAQRLNKGPVAVAARYDQLACWVGGRATTQAKQACSTGEWTGRERKLSPNPQSATFYKQPCVHYCRAAT